MITRLANPEDCLTSCILGGPKPFLVLGRTDAEYPFRERYQARAKAEDASSLPVPGVTVSITNPSSNVPTPSGAGSSKVVQEKRSLLNRWVCVFSAC